MTMSWRGTRRQLLLWTTVATGGLLAACRQQETPTPGTSTQVPGPSPTSAAPVGAQTPTAEQQGATTPAPQPTEPPRRGGILAFAIDADPPGFDIHQQLTAAALWILTPCIEPLLRGDPYDPTKLVPALATEYEISEDRLTYTFRIKQGVKFHDGTPLTSRDVRASLERVVWPPEGVAVQRRTTFQVVDAIENPDDYTVRVHLKRPDSSMLTALQVGIYPAHLIESGADLNRPENVIGTGPFRLKRYTPSVSVELERNPEYHVEGLPYLDGITAYIMPDPNTVVTAFLSGQLHIIRPLFQPPLDLLQRQLGDDLVVEHRPTPVNWGITVMPSKLDPWKDPRVRLAASLVIDRDAMHQAITRGYTKIGGQQYPDGPWALPLERLRQAAGFSTDKNAEIERARQLMAEAGYANGFDVRILTAQGEPNEPAMLFVRDAWAKIGIRATLDVKELGLFVSDIINRNFEATQSIFSVSIADPTLVWREFVPCDTGGNFANICQDDYVQLLDQIITEADDTRRKQLVNELDFRLIDEVGNARIFLGWLTITWGLYRPSLVTWTWGPYGPADETHMTTWLKQ